VDPHIGHLINIDDNIAGKTGDLWQTDPKMGRQNIPSQVVRIERHFHQ